GELLSHEEHLAFRGNCKYAAEGELLAPILEELRQPEWRIGEVEGSVGAVDEIVGAVEALALIAIRENRLAAVRLQSDCAAIAMLVDRQASLPIESQAVGSGLAVLGDVGARVAARLAEDLELPVGNVLVDRVAVRIGEEQELLLRNPDGSLGEREPFR